MCDTCHAEKDARFPSRLKLGEKCKDCHGAREFAPAEWSLAEKRPVRLLPARVAEGPASAGAKVELDCRLMLEQHGFELAAEGGEAMAEITVELKTWRVRESRFVAPGEQVFEASVIVAARRTGGAIPGFKRKGNSHPEFSKDPEEAATAAARDAFRVVSGHLAEALKD